MSEYMMDKQKRNGFEYPFSFVKTIELNLVDFDVWFLLDAKLAEGIMNGMKKRYPKSQLIPFAKRGDNDDVACFEPGRGDRVQIIHDFASEGYERRGSFDSFWLWLEQAVRDMIEFNKEEELYQSNHE